MSRIIIFNSKSLWNLFSEKSFYWWRRHCLQRKTIPTPVKIKAKLSHRLRRRIARRKIGFRGERRELINVIYINPKWRGGNIDVRFTTSLRWFTRSFIAQYINKIFIHFSCMSQQSYLYCQGFVDVHVNASCWEFGIT